jgi:hypothetical protein
MFYGDILETHVHLPLPLRATTLKHELLTLPAWEVAGSKEVALQILLGQKIQAPSGMEEKASHNRVGVCVG